MIVNMLLDGLAMFVVLLVLVRVSLWLRRWYVIFTTLVKNEISAFRQKSNQMGFAEALNQRWKEIDELDDEEAERLVREAFGGHKDVWIDVDGHQQRVLGDPNMSEETKKALAGLVKAATEAVERGDFDNDDEETVTKDHEQT